MTVLHPLHPAAWVLDQLGDNGWHVDRLLSFTRASTLALIHRPGQTPVVLKAGFGNDHVLSELDPDLRAAAYGFYWYRALTAEERRLSRADFRHEIDTARDASGVAQVVPLLDEGTLPRFDWYTMPYLAEGDFRTLLSAPDPDLAYGYRVLADIAAALVGLHQLGVVHRDVYAENILLDNGKGHLTDLGASRRLGIPRGPSGRPPEPHWPPEYSTSYATATPAADVYSLAVLTYRFTSGDLPRLHGDAHLTQLPAPLRDVISAALLPASSNRPAMTELHHALKEAATTPPLPTSS
ncbi:protein kinase domain-containing protein [Actinomadura rupiterrae]|uniref:protein kinase domain-containing protein n=1 Tax=Actinomadura rupiterrae TaxID=559627 RepID=UPI0020A4E54D|nr:protein kinase [Actinomadura rupiterrae]MCP2337542.1 serine/threonine-protein kinase [Actinomadura rupiterrae]